MHAEGTVTHALHDVNVGTKSLVDYRSTLIPGMYDEIVALGKELDGVRVCHLSATAFGGGVAEIMYTLIPLMRDAGVQAHWQIIHGQEEFFEVTKLLHNTLQGADDELTADQRDIWWRYQRLNAELLDPAQYDVVVIHDPQPLGLRSCFEGDGTKWLWRCHIDLSTPNADVLAFLLPEIERYDGSFFHRPEYVPPGLSTAPAIVPPAIDPLAPKNMALSDHDARYIVGQFGIDAERPLMTQVSRFDPWKDPLGVIDTYRIVKERVPDVQLALVGSMAHDDPEGWEFYNQTVDHAGDDSDIYILSNLNNVGAVEVNAFQVCSDVVLQKSIREGFGLTVSEALWKAIPVVAGDVGGIRSQIEHGQSGYLVSNVDEAAHCCLEIYGDQEAAHQMARAGKEYVRAHFLTPRYLRDHLRAYRDVLAAR